MARPVIALLTDFGTRDHYAGTMKGVALGICPDATGTNGNISADPLFAKKFHLQPTSPAIDVGTNAGAPPRDIDNDPRPLDGNGDGSAITDMGADEVKPPA